eukprot:385358_1
MRFTTTTKEACAPTNVTKRSRYFKTITSENDTFDDETLFQELCANLAPDNIDLSKQNVAKISTALHQYPMIGPIRSPRGYKWAWIWSCDNTNCVKNKHHHKKNYRSEYFVSLKLDHSFVLCQDCSCVVHKEANIRQMKKAKEDQKEVEENTEIIVKKNDKTIENYISSLNLENIELDHDECFPILNSIPRCGLIKYCDHFGIRYSTRSKDMILLRKVTKHFILYNRCKNNNRSIDDIERRVFGHCCAS